MTVHTDQVRKGLWEKGLIRSEEPWNRGAVTTTGRGCAEVDNIQKRAGFAAQCSGTRFYTFLARKLLDLPGSEHKAQRELHEARRS